MPPDAVRGIPWTLVTYAATRVVTVLTTLVLARLLVPADFGLFAMATLGMELLSVFSGLWIGAALIVRGDMDRRAEGTVLTLLVAAGALLALVLVVVSPALGAFFGEPRLTGIVVVLGAVLAISGVNWFYETLLQRELAFRRRFVSQIVNTVAFSTVAIGLGVLGAGVWSLVLGYVAGYVANLGALLVLTPYRVSPAFDRGAARRILRDGRGFLGQNLAAYLGANVDYIAVGRLLGPSQLGFYAMAYRQAELPYYAIAEPVTKVTFPAFAQMRRRGEDVTASFLRGLRHVALVTCPIGVVLSAAAVPFAVTMFGEAWRPMAGPLAVLGIWAVLRPIQVTVGSLLNSFDQARIYGRVSMLSLIPLAAGTFAAAALGGMTAVACVLLAVMAATVAVLVIAAGRHAGVPVRAQARALWPLAAASAAAWAVTRAIAEGLAAGAPAPVALGAAAAGCAASYLAVLALLSPGLIPGAVSDARRALGRPSLGRVPLRAPSPLPALALVAAACAGALAGVAPKPAVGLVGAGLILALPFFAPVTHLVLLLAVTAIVPFDVLNAAGIGGGTQSSAVLPVDLLLLGGLARAGLVLLDTPLERRATLTVALVAAFLTLAVLQVLHGFRMGSDVGTAGSELRIMLGFGTAVIALPILADPVARSRLFKGLIGLGLAVGLWGIVQWTVDIPFTAAQDAGVRAGVRFTSAGRGQIQGALFAFPVAVVMGAAAFMSGAVRSTTARVLLAVVVGLNGIDLVLTYERTFWIATLVALGLVAVTAAPGRRVRGLAIAFSFVAVVVLGMAVVAPRDLTAARQRLLSVGQYDSDASLRYRVTENRAVAQAIAGHPLTGSGLGATVLWGRPYQSVPPRTVSFSHNGYLWVAWKLGAPAAIMLVLLLVAAVLSRGPPAATPLGALRAGARAAIVLLLIVNFVFPAFNSLGITAVMGLLIALCVTPRAWSARQEATA